MPSDPSQPPPTLSEAEASYRRYLERQHEVDFEEYCRARPHLEAELRRLHGEQSAGSGYRPPSVSSNLGSRLTQQYQEGGQGEAAAADAAALHQLTRAAGQRYLLQGEIARGGMGAILKVWDSHLRRNLAMKVILGSENAPRGESTGVSARTLNRFLEEAQVTGQLDHPGVVPVHELGIDDGGQVYFTMRLVKGRDFDKIIELARANKDGWTPSRALTTLSRVCETMAYAHSKGVVHRDLKPANLMVGRFGEAYVMDWGLSKVVGSEEDGPTSLVDVNLAGHVKGDDALAELTQHGSVLGTPCYMSPEQARGQLDLIGPHSDVYSMGCILYQLLTGVRPYMPEGSVVSAMEVLEQVLRAPPIPVAKLAPKVSPELVAICEKAMAREIRDRYPTMLQMGEDLRSFLEGRVVRAYQSGAFAQLKKLVARNKATAAAVVGAVLLAMVGSILFAVQSRARAREIAAEQDKTEKARVAAVQNLAVAVRESYVTNLIAADTSLRDNEVREAKRHLRACAEEHRGWEWRHLWWRSDTSLASLPGHGGHVLSLAFDPAGRRLATGGADRVVRLWEAGTGSLVRELKGHEDAVMAVGFAGDGRLFSFAGWSDNKMRVWDVAAGEQGGDWLSMLLPMPEHAGYAFAIRPDGRRVAYVSAEHEVLVMDAASGVVERRLVGHERAVHALVFGADGRRLVSGSEDGAVLVWDEGEDQPVHRLRASGAVHAVALHPGGRELAAGLDDGTVQRWELGEEPEPLPALTGHHGLVYSIAYGPDGSRLATGSLDKTVRVWEADSGAEVAVLRGHEEPVRCVAFGQDGRLLASGSNDETVRAWLPWPAGVVEIDLDCESVSSVAASADGSKMLIGSAYPGVVALRPFGPGAESLRLGPEQDDDAAAVALSPDGNFAAAGYRDECRVWIHDLAGDRSFALPQLELSVTAVAFHPDGARVVSGSDDQVVCIWDLERRECVTQLEGHESKVTSVAVHPGGRLIASGSLDGTVRLWDVESGKQVRQLDGPDEGFHAVAFGPGGELVAAGGGDSKVWVWEVESGRRVAALQGHEQRVTSVAFHPDGTRLISGSMDSNLRVWDPRVGAPDEERRSLLTLRGHRGPVTGVAVSGDGARVVSTSEDGTVRVWEAQSR